MGWTWTNQDIFRYLNCQVEFVLSERPFKTWHNDLKLEMYLRIAPELHLKQLVIGGFDRVFEVGRQFRNEGVDSTHNPEFTTCEFYMAYADCADLMNLTEQMLGVVAANVTGSTKFSYPMHDGGGRRREMVFDFGEPFKRVGFLPAIQTFIGKELPAPEEVYKDEPKARYVCNVCLADAVTFFERSLFGGPPFFLPPAWCHLHTCISVENSIWSNYL